MINSKIIEILHFKIEEKMKLNFLFALLILIFSFHVDLYSQKKTVSENPLIGKWETVHNPLESTLLTLNFKKDKKFSYKLTSKWSGKYQLNGTTLISNYYIPILNKIVTDSSTVLIYSDTLIQVTYKKGKSQTFKMIRKDGMEKGAGIIGSWKVLNPDAQEMSIKYNTNGTFEIHKILKAFNGFYIVKGNTFQVYSNRMLMMRSEFEFIRGDLMLYSKTSKGPIRMIRAKD